MTAIMAGIRVEGRVGEGVQMEGGTRLQGAAPTGGSGDDAPRLTRNELKMFHEQILSRNEA